VTQCGKRGLAWLVVGLVAAIAMYASVRGAWRAAAESGQRSLIAQAERQLMLHYAVHSRYPDSLDGMHFKFSDGADAATLSRVDYHTDGESYWIETPSDFDGSTIRVSMDGDKGPGAPAR